jgi:hypothetical protein
MTVRLGTGRTLQKERTRSVIVAAAREFITSGAQPTMPAVPSRL